MGWRAYSQYCQCAARNCGWWSAPTSQECEACGGKSAVNTKQQYGGRRRRWGNSSKGNKKEEKEEKEPPTSPEEEEDEEDDKDVETETGTTRKQLKALADARDAMTPGTEGRHKLEMHFNEERQKYNQEKPLQRQIADITRGIEAKQKKLDKLMSNVADLEEELESQREKASDMQLKLSKSQADLKELEARKLQEEVAATPPCAGTGNEEDKQLVTNLRQQLEVEQKQRQDMKAHMAQMQSQMQSQMQEQMAQMRLQMQAQTAQMQAHVITPIATVAPEAPLGAAPQTAAAEAAEHTTPQQEQKPQEEQTRPQGAQMFDLREQAEMEAATAVLSSDEELQEPGSPSSDTRPASGRVRKAKGQYKKDAEEVTFQRVGLPKKG